MGKERTGGAVVGNQNRNGGDKSAGAKIGEQNKDGNAADNGTDAVTAASAIAAAAAAVGAGTAEGAGNKPSVNPAALAPDNIERDELGNPILGVNGKPKKKRGRKPGQQYGASPTAPKSTPAKSDSARAAIATEMLAAQFAILNTGIAYLTNFPDFKLDDQEAQDMAAATANVMAQFDYVPDPKVAAVLGLVTTTSMIYGPRVYFYRKHLAEKRAEKKDARIKRADERAANGAVFNGPENWGQFSGN
jgi:hypothetical protein